MLRSKAWSLVGGAEVIAVVVAPALESVTPVEWCYVSGVRWWYGSCVAGGEVAPKVDVVGVISLIASSVWVVSCGMTSERNP